MGWTIPSWVAIALGAVSLGLAVWVFLFIDTSADAVHLFAPLFIGGSILLAAGLHGLQAAWSSCCDCGYGCDCDHCADCAGGGCCGECGCVAGHGHGDGEKHTH